MTSFVNYVERKMMLVEFVPVVVESDIVVRNVRMLIGKNIVKTAKFVVKLFSHTPIWENKVKTYTTSI